MKYLLTLTLALILPFLLQAQDFTELDKSPMDMAYYPARAAFAGFSKTAEEKASLQPKIRVIYSRPMKKGRDIWGAEKMAPYGEAYRLGANENTEIQFYVPVMLGDQVIPAGRYTLGAIPMKDKWTVFVNTDIDTWGVYGYDAARNVATIEVPTAKSEEVIEAFSIVLYEAPSGMVHLKMGWDKTMVEVPFKLLK
ncbi:asparagine synthetase B [Lewinellaceae bacterium SD302]|nr:asparagine synthetase B [Lewinellaceae bacterium SD302]